MSQDAARTSSAGEDGAPGRFAGRVVVVTGSAAGIGAAVAQRVLAEGGQVAGLDIDSCHPFGASEYLHLSCDVTDPDAVAGAVSAVHQRFGRIDGLVNSAGGNAASSALDMTDAEWDAVIGIDLKAAWLCARAMVPHMRRQRGGAIVNVTSVHSRLTTVGMFHRAAAKAGLEGLTRGLALELAADDIRVNAVAPGRIRTRLVQEWLGRQAAPSLSEKILLSSQPQGRTASPADIALVVAFALSSDARAMTGAVLPVDCGLGVRLVVD